MGQENTKKKKTGNLTQQSYDKRRNQITLKKIESSIYFSTIRGHRRILRNEKQIKQTTHPNNEIFCKKVGNIPKNRKHDNYKQTKKAKSSDDQLEIEEKTCFLHKEINLQHGSMKTTIDDKKTRTNEDQNEKSEKKERWMTLV